MSSPSPVAIEFRGGEAMTLGVELELQLLDARSRDLSPAAPRVFEALGKDHPRVRPEFFQSMVEITTGVCQGVHEARPDLQKTLSELRGVCQPLGLDLVSAGSHPFARHADRVVHPSDRFKALLERNRWIAQRLMIFGLHVHVGCRDGEHATAMINGMLWYLPHLLALSASSPFWQGADTGLASSRITLFEALPTAGHAVAFGSWADFRRFFGAAVRSGAITSHKDLWWDIRPSPDYGTVEVRICDAPATLTELMSVVTLTHLLLRWLDRRRAGGEALAPPPEWLIRENKWRASRWGLEADIVQDDLGQVLPLRQAIGDLLGSLEVLAISPDEREGLAGVHGMLSRPGSHARQREVFRKAGTLEAVVEALVTEFRTDAPVA